MALLPLAGFAAGPVDITGYQITLSSAEATYTATDITLPTVSLTKNGADPIAQDKVKVVWKKGSNEVTKATVAGDYVVTVTAKDGSSVGTLTVNTKTFTVKKRDLIVKVSDLGVADASAKHKTYGFKVADFASESNTDWGIWAVSGETGEGFQEETANQPTLNVLVNWGTDVNAGEHTFTLSADALANYNVVFKPSDTGKWWIDKKDLAVTANPFALTYGDEFNGDEHVTYDGFIDGEDEKVLGGDLDFTTNYTKGSGITTATNTYSYQPTGLTSNNYNISYNNGVITVNPKNISQLTITNFEDVTYNKLDQRPKTITATFLDKPLEASVTGTEPVTKDYNLKYYKTRSGNATEGYTYSDEITTSGTYTTVRDAGTYWVEINGDGNFTGKAYKSFIIKKKQLGIRTKDKNVVYDATDKYNTVTGAQANADNLIFSGLIPASTSGTTTIEADAYPAILKNGNNKITLKLRQNAADVTKAINAGDYDIVVDQSNVSDLFTNYEPVFADGGQLKIAQRKLEIKTKNKSKKFGETDNFVAGVVATKDDVTVVEATASTPDVGLVNNTTSSPNIVHVITAYPLLKRAKGENKANYEINLVEDDTHKLVIKASSADNAEDVTNNYKVTFTKGTFTISAGQISIFADEKTFTYGEKTVAAANQSLTATIVGMTEAEKAQVQAAVNAALSIEIDENLELADDDLLPANTTGYSIKIGDLTSAIPTAILANYDTNINKFDEEAKFIVNKKELTKVTAKQQALQLGQKLSDLIIDATTIEVEGLAEGDLAADVIKEMKLKFATYVTVNTTTGVLETPTSTNQNEYKDGTYLKAILFDETVPMYNYKYPTAAAKKVAGNLVITTANQALTLDASLATNTATLTANVGKKLNVTIKEKRLKAGYWYTIALPFDITPYRFTQAIGGYAIFDRLQTTGDKLSFKISMDAIPAYTPFLVKVDAAVDFKDVVFEKVDIVAPAAKTEANDVWKVVSTIDKGDVTGLVYWLNRKDDGINLGRNSSGAPFNGFDAYITTISGQPASEARIYIEEADGSTTAISAIAADGQLVSAEGWYTLNGVKLQGVPTEKGVYIQNGKKVVIK